MTCLSLTTATAIPLAALFNPGATYIHDCSSFQSSGFDLNRAFKETFVAPPAASGVGRGTDRWLFKVTPSGTQGHGSVMRSLARLRTFASWGDNWDGDGASAPDKAAVNSAALVLGFLHSKLGRAPNVSLNADGEPTLTLMDSEFEMVVTVRSNTEIAYIVAFGDHERAGLANFDARKLPSEISSALSELRPVAD